MFTKIWLTDGGNPTICFWVTSHFKKFEYIDVCVFDESVEEI